MIFDFLQVICILVTPWVMRRDFCDSAARAWKVNIFFYTRNLNMYVYGYIVIWNAWRVQIRYACMYLSRYQSIYLSVWCVWLYILFISIHILLYTNVFKQMHKITQTTPRNPAAAPRAPGRKRRPNLRWSSSRQRRSQRKRLMENIIYIILLSLGLIWFDFDQNSFSRERTVLRE